MMAPVFARVGMPVFGALPREDQIVLPERHLGLVQARDLADIDARIDALADQVEAVVDLDAIRQAAGQPAPPDRRSEKAVCRLRPPGQRIALAHDAAFSFMYPHLLRLWRHAGAEDHSVLATSGASLRMRRPTRCGCPAAIPSSMPASSPSADGFRRVCTISRAAPFRSMASAAATWCWGAVMEDADGHRHEMAGLLGLETSFAQRRLHLGYRRARLRASCSLGAVGTEVLGPQFQCRARSRPAANRWSIAWVPAAPRWRSRAFGRAPRQVRSSMSSTRLPSDRNAYRIRAAARALVRRACKAAAIRKVITVSSGSKNQA